MGPELPTKSSLESSIIKLKPLLIAFCSGSKTGAHLVQDTDAYNFVLTDSDVTLITTLGTHGGQGGQDPHAKRHRRRRSRKKT